MHKLRHIKVNIPSIRYTNGILEISITINQHFWYLVIPSSEDIPIFKVTYVNPLRNLANILYSN